MQIPTNHITDYAEGGVNTLDNAGFECSTFQCDLGDKASILNLVRYAQGKGEVHNLINAAGVSPSQAFVERILQVDLYGTSVLLEEFGKVTTEGDRPYCCLKMPLKCS